ncbi:MAG: Gldg family protein [Spirochaetota bacterium]
MKPQKETFLSRALPYLSLATLLLFFLLRDFFFDSSRTLFTVFCFLLLSSDSIYSLLHKDRNNRKSRLFINSLAIAAVTSYLVRDYLQIPVRPGIAEEATLLPGLRDFLLVVVVLSTLCNLLFTLVLEVSYLSRQAQSGVAKEKLGLMNHTFYNFLILLPFLIAINYLAVQRNFHFDLTSNDKYSLSSASKNILQNIKEEISITAFYPRPLESSKSADKKSAYILSILRPEIEIFLNQVRATNPLLESKFINSEVETELLGGYENISNGTIVVRKRRENAVSGEKPYIEQKVTVANKTDLDQMEANLMQAILNVATQKKNIYFTAANGERYHQRFQKIPEERLQGLLDGLTFMNNKIQGMDFSNKWPSDIPKDADVLAIIGPTVPFRQEAQEALWKYVLEKKGNLFIALEPYGSEDFSWMLEKAGLSYKNDILTQIEGKHGLIKTDKFAKHPISKLLSSYRYGIFYPFAGYLQEDTTKQKQAEWKVTKLLQSDYSAFPDTNKNGRKEKEEIRKQRLLGVVLSPKDKNLAAKAGKIILYSGTAWLTNRFLPPLRNPTTASFMNSPYALNHFIWLNQGIIIEDIPKKQEKVTSFVLTPGQKKFVWVIGMFLYPGCIIAFGSIYVVLKRRNKS